MLLQENIPLAPLTTFRLGGPARFFVAATHRRRRCRKRSHSRRRKNCRFSSWAAAAIWWWPTRGWPGLVLKIAIPGIEQQSRSQRRRQSSIRCRRGRILGSLGLACGHGAVRGRRVPKRNSRAAWAEHLCRMSAPTGRKFPRRSNRCRSSTARTGKCASCAIRPAASLIARAFSTPTERERFIILRVVYALMPGGEPHLAYADLKRHFEGRETRPNLAETREAVRHIRARKGMLILSRDLPRDSSGDLSGDPDSQSAGSFFKNPVLSEAQHEDLQKRAAAKGLRLPSYPALEQRQQSFSGLAGGKIRLRPWIRLWPRRHFEQTCARHRESRRGHGGGSPRLERPDPAARRRTLGRELRARTGDGRLLGLCGADTPVRRFWS